MPATAAPGNMRTVNAISPPSPFIKLRAAPGIVVRRKKRNNTGTTDIAAGNLFQHIKPVANAQWYF